MTAPAGEDVAKGKHLLLLELQTCKATMEISMVVPWESGIRFTLRSSYTTLGIYPKD